MSKKDKNQKSKTLTSSKIKENNDSQSKTYLDSLHSKLSHTEKENINDNNSINNIIIENIKENNIKYISKQKQKNFYMALKSLNTDKGHYHGRLKQDFAQEQQHESWQHL